MARWSQLLFLLCLSVVGIHLVEARGNATFRPLRKNRYLAFPMKANVLITINLLKALNLPFMKGLNSLHELDVFVPLPQNIHSLLFDKHHQNHRSERKLLYHNLKKAFSWCGINLAYDRYSGSLTFKLKAFNIGLGTLTVVYTAETMLMVLPWHGLDGRECILKALCETRMLVRETNENLLIDLLTTVFKLPNAEEDLEYKLNPANSCNMNCPFTLHNFFV